MSVKINTRHYSKYLDIQVEVNDTTVDLGFNGRDEAQTILENLEDTVEDIKKYLEQTA